MADYGVGKTMKNIGALLVGGRAVFEPPKAANVGDKQRSHSAEQPKIAVRVP